ncbi:unnamed protein product [Cuscuta campestris]|uniref:Uncharacterized protein n=1 Tax=Cuscuta campestris TaxID=132261 RepID=A0A484L6T4_9ASTE|nr:unnamed protein product [Cuscuta campestris]
MWRLRGWPTTSGEYKYRIPSFFPSTWRQLKMELVLLYVLASRLHSDTQYVFDELSQRDRGCRAAAMPS